MQGKRVCRMHGGKGGAPQGRRHGSFRHGLRTQFLKRKRAEIKFWVAYTNMAATRFRMLQSFTDAIRKARNAERAGRTDLAPFAAYFPPRLAPEQRVAAHITRLRQAHEGQQGRRQVRELAVGEA